MLVSHNADVMLEVTATKNTRSATLYKFNFLYKKDY